MSHSILKDENLQGRKKTIFTIFFVIKFFVQKSKTTNKTKNKKKKKNYIDHNYVNVIYSSPI